MEKKFDILKMNENRDTFFRRVHRFVLPYHCDALIVANAYHASKNAFRGVKRKRGERYFEHCRAVALIAMDVVGVRDAEVVAAALLHDIVEDCSSEWPLVRVYEEFGARIGDLVGALSMPAGEMTREERKTLYHEQLHLGPPETFALKLSDRLHNLSTCDAMTPSAQVRMIAETEGIYIPIARERGILYEELSSIIKERKKSLVV